jgi:hypothetical protein
MSRAVRNAIVAVVIAVVSAACTASSTGEISKSASKLLTPQVQHIRDVAALDDYPQLKAAVANLEDLVQQQEDAGEISPTRANAIRDAADVLLEDARALRPSPSPTSESPTPTPTTESPTPTPTPTETTESPTPSPTPSDTSSPIVSASVGHGSPPSEDSPSNDSG